MHFPGEILMMTMLRIIMMMMMMMPTMPVDDDILTRPFAGLRSALRLLLHQQEEKGAGEIHHLHHHCHLITDHW